MIIDALIVLAVFLVIYFCFLYRPMPKGMAHREWVHFVDFGIRVSAKIEEFLEKLFGPKARIFYIRMLFATANILPRPPVRGVRLSWTRIAGVPVRVWQPRGTDPNENKHGPAIVFIHGGGWAAVHPNYYDHTLSYFVRKLGCTIFGIDYRKSPEHTYPAALNDCIDVVNALCKQELLEYGVSSNEGIVILGDSAGGNLAAAVSGRLRHEGKIKCQILLYPVTTAFGSVTNSYHSFNDKVEGAMLLSPEMVVRSLLMYLGIDAGKENITKVLDRKHIRHGSSKCLDEFVKEYGVFDDKSTAEDKKLCGLFEARALDPSVSPLHDEDPSGIAPTLVCTAGYDILRDEGRAYAEHLKKFGVEVEYINFASAMHGVLNLHFSPVTKKMKKDISAFILKHI